MARPRKRVLALRRAADGSAFEKCDRCGMSVAIALSDMHDCEFDKHEVKRFRGIPANGDFYRAQEQNFASQPRESLVETSEEESFIDIDRKGFEMWKNMSSEERKPHEIQAEKVNAAYYASLLDEVKIMLKSKKFDDGANSPTLCKFDTFLDDYDNDDDSDCPYNSIFSDSDGWDLFGAS